MAYFISDGEMANIVVPDEHAADDWGGDVDVEQHMLLLEDCHSLQPPLQPSQERRSAVSTLPVQTGLLRLQTTPKPDPPLVTRTAVLSPVPVPVDTDFEEDDQLDEYLLAMNSPFASLPAAAGPSLQPTTAGLVFEEDDDLDDYLLALKCPTELSPPAAVQSPLPSSCEKAPSLTHSLHETSTAERSIVLVKDAQQEENLLSKTSLPAFLSAVTVPPPRGSNETAPTLPHLRSQARRDFEEAGPSSRPDSIIVNNQNIRGTLQMDNILENTPMFRCPKDLEEVSDCTVVLSQIKGNPGQTYFACIICDDFFPFRHNLTAHTVEKHKTHACHFCKELFTTRAKLYTHRASEHQIPRMSCDICNHVFTTLSSLARHQKNVHDGKRAHICETCGRPFNRQTDLQRHKKCHDRALDH